MGIGMMDCLIASVSLCLQLPLYTRNLRHFTPLLGTLAVKPY
jgi:predicted nucleic acid-binding protein